MALVIKASLEPWTLGGDFNQFGCTLKRVAIYELLKSAGGQLTLSLTRTWVQLPAMGILDSRPCPRIIIIPPARTFRAAKPSVWRKLWSVKSLRPAEAERRGAERDAQSPQRPERISARPLRLPLLEESQSLARTHPQP